MFDYASRAALRAVISGLMQSGKIDMRDCESIVAAIDQAGTQASLNVRGDAAGYLDLFAAEVAKDCFGLEHPLYIAAKRKSETD